MGLREVVIPGLSWVIGDGKKTRFWKDKWLMTMALEECVTVPLPAGAEELRVCDLWEIGLGWRLDRITQYVAHEVRLRLAAVVVDEVTGARDRFSWNGSLDGQFSVRSAYRVLTTDDSPKQDLRKLFDSVWKVVAPERVKVFLWLGVNQVIMTNIERQRRHLSDSGICQVCKGGEETILHVLRDCPAMYGLWLRIIPRRRRTTFFTMSLLEWVYDNLRDHKVIWESPWSTVFSMAVWWGWKWRCGYVFGVTGRCRDRVSFIKDLAREVAKALSLIHI